jgi:hypothetical protein
MLILKIHTRVVAVAELAAQVQVLQMAVKTIEEVSVAT